MTTNRVRARLQRGLAKALPATSQERAAALWSFSYFFTLLAGYYVLRPLRDQMGIAGGVRALPWMFSKGNRSKATRPCWASIMSS